MCAQRPQERSSLGPTVGRLFQPGRRDCSSHQEVLVSLNPATLLPYSARCVRNVGQWFCVPPFRVGLPLSGFSLTRSGDSLPVPLAVTPSEKRSVLLWIGSCWCDRQSPCTRDDYHPMKDSDVVLSKACATVGETVVGREPSSPEAMRARHYSHRTMSVRGGWWLASATEEPASWAENARGG